MSGEPVPIRPGVAVECDAEREMVEYLMCRVKNHMARWGEAPHTAAIVTTSIRGRCAHSFSLLPDSDRLEVCATAATLLMRRATIED